MKWTTEPPKEKGWYWIKVPERFGGNDEGSDSPMVVYVCIQQGHENKGFQFIERGWHYPNGGINPLTTEFCDAWCGPLNPPEA